MDEKDLLNGGPQERKAGRRVEGHVRGRVDRGMGERDGADFEWQARERLGDETVSRRRSGRGRRNGSEKWRGRWTDGRMEKRLEERLTRQVRRTIQVGSRN